MKARTYKSVQSKPYNTLQKIEGPSQTYHQNILCLHTGYPPIRTLCITNKKKELAPKKLEDTCFVILYNDFTRGWMTTVLFQAVHRVLCFQLQTDLFSGLSNPLRNINKEYFPGIKWPRCKHEHSLP